MMLVVGGSFVLARKGLFEGSLSLTPCSLLVLGLLSKAEVLVLVARMSAPFSMVDLDPVDIAVDLFNDREFQVGFVFITALHPTLLLQQVIMGLLVGSAVGSDLVGGEVVTGVLAPRRLTLYSIMVKVELYGLQHGL